MGADETVGVLERVVERRGRAPTLIRCDNGPEFIAQALRDWCRFAGVATGYIEPGAPWQNPFVESFNGHLRRELLEMESFDTLYEAQLLLDDWRQEYNHYRPHQSLSYQTPAEYARRWRTERTEEQPEFITTGPKNGVRSRRLWRTRSATVRQATATQPRTRDKRRRGASADASRAKLPPCLDREPSFETLTLPQASGRLSIECSNATCDPGAVVVEFDWVGEIGLSSRRTSPAGARTGSHLLYVPILTALARGGDYKAWRCSRLGSSAVVTCLCY